MSPWSSTKRAAHPGAAAIETMVRATRLDYPMPAITNGLLVLDVGGGSRRNVERDALTVKGDQSKRTSLSMTQPAPQASSYTAASLPPSRRAFGLRSAPSSTRVARVYSQRQKAKRLAPFRTRPLRQKAIDVGALTLERWDLPKLAGVPRSRPRGVRWGRGVALRRAAARSRMCSERRSGPRQRHVATSPTRTQAWWERLTLVWGR